MAFDKVSYRESLEYYENSLKMFNELDDKEHVGIANLQTAKAMIMLNRKSTEILSRLNAAEMIFLELGWLEGQANVHEQMAVFYSRLVNRTTTGARRNELLDRAISAITRSRTIFTRIDNQKRLGRAEAILEDLKMRRERQIAG